jgi:DNA polymerase III delta subunit
MEVGYQFGLSKEEAVLILRALADQIEQGVVVLATVEVGATAAQEAFALKHLTVRYHEGRAA